MQALPQIFMASDMIGIFLSSGQPSPSPLKIIL
jgi:hypothetical protein